MAKRAFWRTAPGDPRTPLGWLLADGHAGKIEPGATVALLFLLGTLALLWNSWLLLALPILALGTRRRPRNNDLSLLGTSPPPGPSFACRIETMAGMNVLGWGTLLGGDEGYVTFVDGWLHFAGRRTDFAVRRVDAGTTENGASGPRLELPNDNTLRLRAIDERNGERLCRAFTLWSNAPTPEGEPILPPEGINPLGLARAWHGVLMTCAWGLIALGITIVTDLGFVVVIGFSGIGIPASFRQFAMVRRLARADRVALTARRRPAVERSSEPA